MSNSKKIQLFLEQNKHLFEDLDFELEQNQNILNVFNSLSKKYDELLKHPIKLEKPIKINFKQTIQENKPKQKNTKSNKKKLNKRKKKTKRKEFEGMNVYLNDLDSCDHFNQKDNFRLNYIKVLQLLYTKYNNILQEIYQEHKYHPKFIERLNDFLKTLSKKSLKELTEWVNFEGILIARSIYVMYLNRRLPEEINNLFGSSPELLGEFTSLDIQRDIQLNLKYTYFYDYTINGIQLKLETHHSKKLNKIYPDKKLIYRIVFLNYLTDKQLIDLKLWYSKRKKILPISQTSNKNTNGEHVVNQKYLGAREINSGCTTFTGSLPNKVSIWRNEEMPKVMLHELCHSLELEESHELNDFKEYIYTHFDIKREIPIRLFESYVETWANFINILLIVKNLGNNRKNRRVFMNLLEIEIKWSLFQAAKILDFFGYSTFEEFYFQNGIEEQNKTPKFLQKSNIFSYTILRSTILFNLDKFMSLCKKYNPESVIIKDQIPQEEKINLLRNNLINYSKIINKILKFIRENKNEQNYIYKSTRLTCIE